MKIWKYHPEQCEFCGSDSEIYTDEDLPAGWGYDCDEMRCTECGALGKWNVYDENDAWASWYEETIGNNK